MQTLDQALANLVKRNLVAPEEAMMKSSTPARLRGFLQLGPYDALLSAELKHVTSRS